MRSGYEVSSRGIRVPRRLRQVVDVEFGAERVWSFSPGRDRPKLSGGWIPWPAILEAQLNGVADVRLLLHGDGVTVFAGTVRFGQGTDPIRVQDQDGQSLAVDKAGHLVRSFASTDRAMVESVLDGAEQVLRDLRGACGLDAFLSFGCLLGAVRDGRMIGHDGDVDVSYLSAHTHPFDIIRENKHACDTMRSLGWTITRMSAGDFKVWIKPGGGRRVGIDVFSSFYVDGRFHMVPSVTGELSRDALLPIGEVTLEGRSFVAPARPEELLELTYGPGWRVPDPSFAFDPPRDLLRRLNGWLRNNRKHLRHWGEFYKTGAVRRVPTTPSAFATWVDRQLAPGQHVLDVGAGNGRDSVFFSQQGHRVSALDASVVARKLTRRAAREAGVRVRPADLNLNDLYSVLTSGAGFAHLDQPPQIYARFLLDCIEGDSRRNFFRWAQMIQRRGGTTYLEFRTWRGTLRARAFPFHYRTLLNPRRVIAEIEAAGGSVVQCEQGVGLARFEKENPRVCRLVVRWS